MNPLARGAQAALGEGSDAILAKLAASSGSPERVAEHLRHEIERGKSDYLVLQLPTGDMSFDEAKASLRLFIDEVMPALA